MNITTAFLEEVKKNKWPIYYVHPKERFKVGDEFRIVGSKYATLTSVVLTPKRGNKETVLTPIRGSLKVMSTDNNGVQIKFDYKYGREIETFFMRFHFFKKDPAVFTYWRQEFDEDASPCECCECCCCNSSGVKILAISSHDDGDRGGGGGGARFH